MPCAWFTSCWRIRNRIQPLLAVLRRSRRCRSCGCHYAFRHPPKLHQCLSTLADANPAGPTAASDSPEAVYVPCGSNSSVRLDIYRPSVKQDRSGKIFPTILYLPSGPIADIDFKKHDERIIAALSASSSATIVRVNYHLGNGVYYPTPIHDVLSAYDWVRHDLMRDSSTVAAVARCGRARRKIPRLGVCGQLIGGSLAAMLALTESRMGEHTIAAAALNNPIVDWLFPELPNPPHGTTTAVEDAASPDEPIEPIANETPFQPTTSKTKTVPSFIHFRNAHPVSARSLLTTRANLFRKLSSPFDPFASPILFFRSPGTAIPSDPTLTPAPTSKPRKVHRMFPPAYSTMRIPMVRISLGTESPLRDQGEELVRLMRRSVVRSVREGRNGFARVAKGYGVEGNLEEREVEEARRIECWLVRGSGVWGVEGEEGWTKAVGRVGEWFGEVLG